MCGTSASARTASTVPMLPRSEPVTRSPTATRPPCGGAVSAATNSSTFITAFATSG